MVHVFVHILHELEEYIFKRPGSVKLRLRGSYNLFQHLQETCYTELKHHTIFRFTGGLVYDGIRIWLSIDTALRISMSEHWRQFKFKPPFKRYCWTTRLHALILMREYQNPFIRHSIDIRAHFHYVLPIEPILACSIAAFASLPGSESLQLLKTERPPEWRDLGVMTHVMLRIVMGQHVLRLKCSASDAISTHPTRVCPKPKRHSEFTAELRHDGRLPSPPFSVYSDSQIFDGRLLVVRFVF
ncbi:hypothetical protein ABKN59_011787 [Abortiporus biennis]